MARNPANASSMVSPASSPSASATRPNTIASTTDEATYSMMPIPNRMNTIVKMRPLSSSGCTSWKPTV